jgi:hypothetical protein
VQHLLQLGIAERARHAQRPEPAAPLARAGSAEAANREVQPAVLEAGADVIGLERHDDPVVFRRGFLSEHDAHSMLGGSQHAAGCTPLSARLALPALGIRVGSVLELLQQRQGRAVARRDRRQLLSSQPQYSAQLIQVRRHLVVVRQREHVFVYCARVAAWLQVWLNHCSSIRPFRAHGLRVAKHGLMVIVVVVDAHQECARVTDIRDDEMIVLEERRLYHERNRRGAAA